jgi:DNA-directed RNA polymerase sigma subunit (sigma70/sigma32)
MMGTPYRHQRARVIWNLHCHMGRSYGRIARSAGISRERVRQIVMEETARRRLTG